MRLGDYTAKVGAQRVPVVTFLDANGEEVDGPDGATRMVVRMADGRYAVLTVAHDAETVISIAFTRH